MSVVLFVLLVGVVIILFRERARRREGEASLAAAAQERESAKQETAAVQAAYEREWHRAEALSSALAQTQNRLDVVEGLGEIEDALAYSSGLRTFAEKELEAAKAVRQHTEAEVRALLRQAEIDRSGLVAQGQAERARLVLEAETRAREIAGSAYDLAQREAQLKKTIQAFENVIKGYGDEYLVPTSAVLDELEQRYGFSDVGRSLKTSRKAIGDMIKTGSAATCDYVEANRRDTAVAFVLDAFNGKVDSILAGAKHDNFGKLKQKVEDSFLLINRLGAAFRNARVELPYLEAQVEVLKWTVAAHELKRLEKEEQRALREQMREEEKARKEYEKALKEASRDEEVARKAVEKARADLDRASEAERAKYEAKLAELAERLRAAEERGQRALSMAQQTRSGNVYVISNIGSFGDDVFKIGMTRRLEPEDRVRELGDASVPFGFDIHAMIRTEDAPTLEKALHKRFLRDQVNKVNPRKEFFRVSLPDIKAEVERMGIDAAWTMSAACAEWRESQVIAARVLTDSVEFERWSEGQLREHEHAMLTNVEADEV